MLAAPQIGVKLERRRLAGKKGGKGAGSGAPPEGSTASGKAKARQGPSQYLLTFLCSVVQVVTCWRASASGCSIESRSGTQAEAWVKSVHVGMRTGSMGYSVLGRLEG